MAEGCIIDLVDYCHRKLTELVSCSTHCGIEEIKTRPLLLGEEHNVIKVSFHLHVSIA